MNMWGLPVPILAPHYLKLLQVLILLASSAHAALLWLDLGSVSYFFHTDFGDQNK